MAPFQYSCLENPMDSLVGYSLWGRKESDMTKQLTLSLHFRDYFPTDMKKSSICWSQLQFKGREGRVKEGVKRVLSDSF